MFEPVPNQVDFAKQEHEVLAFWERTKAFDKLRKKNKGGDTFSFIDGPITANNPMGVHHAWGRTYKDLFQRYRAMRGLDQRWQNGFDCQGLWVEVEVEKERGFKTKRDIEAYGLAGFVNLCKQRVLEYSAVQTEQSIRLGYWMDWNDPAVLRDLKAKMAKDPEQVITIEGPNGPMTDTVEMLVGRLGLPELGGSYFTLSNENNYNIWTALKKCHQHGWIYKGTDVMPWCARCGTGISQHEIVTEGYQDLTHPSVFLRFPLREHPGENLLVWTTTPWTLTSNVGAAVHPDLPYVLVEQGDQKFWLSKGALDNALKGPYTVLDETPGAKLEGWTYDGPFDELPAQQESGSVAAHRIILWEEVGEAEGTGIVHIAPGCGAEDFGLGKEFGLPAIAPLSDGGIFVAGFDWLTGMNVHETAQPIFENLEKKGLLYRLQDYTHRYPVCWRCQDELVFRLVDEWFIHMGDLLDKPYEQVTDEEKDSRLRYQIMDSVQETRWIPDFGFEREMDWLRNMHDWMISKKRYWGLALPIWECAECGWFDVIGSDEELEARAVAGWEEFAGQPPHRPYVDAVKIRCESCGATVSRISDVGNPWLDAGIVAYSTLQYRTEADYWQKWFPADLITESFPGQFRNWFYSMLAMSTIMERRAPFRAVQTYATLFAEDGRAMHKSWGNAIEFNDAADTMGVDVMRWMYCAHKPETNLLFGYHRADETRRRFLIPLWNVYSFFVTYANLDHWVPGSIQDSVSNTQLSDLDRWILARLNQVLARATQCMEEYDPYGVTLVIEPLLDDLTNWYVRRSRRRFWKSEQDADKDAAYATLYHVLLTLSKVLAPIVPFVTEVMYQNLARSVGENACESVHHCAWPEPDESAVDGKLLDQMALAMQVAALGRSARSTSNVKLRQPLARARVYAGKQKMELGASLVALVTDELNVKGLEFVEREADLVEYEIGLLPNVLGPKLGKRFPLLRRSVAAADAGTMARRFQAGLSVTLELDDNGPVVELLPEEVEVRTHGREGYAVAGDKNIVVAVDVTLTPELAREGLARDLVRRIQSMRKEADFNLDDRIVTYYEADDEVEAVVEEWGDYIQAETLSLEMVSGPLPADVDLQESQPLEGHPLVLGVRKG
ncbi:MAG TPA: class I tRNA ligase family protein [Anaerolineae bacterium]|nr:class I tRNA ligase family protein [Anaerolineae bacterium]